VRGTGAQFQPDYVDAFFGQGRRAGIRSRRLRGRADGAHDRCDQKQD
jgi:hypothetical protein